MEVPYNGAPKRPGSPSPLTSPAHSTASRGGLLHACCGRCYPQRYQVRGRRILASTTSISEGPPSSSSHSHQSQPSGQPVQSHYQPVDPITVPNVAFNVPGDSDRQRRQGASSSSPYNETRVWAELGTAIPPDRSFLSAWPVIEITGSKVVPPYCSILVFWRVLSPLVLSLFLSRRSLARVWIGVVNVIQLRCEICSDYGSKLRLDIGFGFYASIGVSLHSNWSCELW